MADKRLIDLYPYQIVDSKPVYLLFKRAKGQLYHGQWRMIGGKVENDERYWNAALRELYEETHLTPCKLWTVPSVNTFYEHSTDKILQIPAFAAEITADEHIILDSEHSEYKWFELDQALENIVWPEQQRLLRLTHTIITSNQILDDWLVDIS